MTANIGDWMQQEYSDHGKLKKAIERIVYRTKVDNDLLPACVSLAPTSSVNDLLIALHQLDYSCDAKHGCAFGACIADGQGGKASLFD